MADLREVVHHLTFNQVVQVVEAFLIEHDSKRNTLYHQDGMGGPCICADCRKVSEADHAVFAAMQAVERGEEATL